MQSVFSRKFNEMTSDKFDYIKLTCINVNLKARSIEMCFIYPSEKNEQVLACEAEIKKTIAKIFNLEAELIINLKPVVFDFEYCKQILREFFRKFPSIAPYVNEGEMSYKCLNENETVNLIIPVGEEVLEYCGERNVGAEISDFLESYFTEKICVTFISSTDFRAENENVALEYDVPQYKLSMEGGRKIIPCAIKELIGKPIDEPAMYIEDCVTLSADETVVLCGTVNDFKRLQKADGSKTFYKFTLGDFTGNISCLIFTNKTVTPEKAETVTDGAEIVIKGQLKENTFRGEKSLSVFVRSISFCELPKDFVKNEIYRTTPVAYKTVFPEPYVTETQVGLFEEKQVDEVPESVKGKTYVVYDFETTGLDTRICKIIEIGAVKIIDGKFTETFSTLVNPGEKLEQRIVDTTNITDEMLLGKPTIEDVLPDFNLFCDGAVLVGQNSNEFDYKILLRVAAEQKFCFSSQHEDTMVMAKKLLRRVHNYKLATLAKYFGVVNENAHRALDDAVTTAKVFLNLAKML